MTHALSNNNFNRRVRSFLRSPIKKPLQYAWARSRETLFYLRGKWILTRYSNHYRSARRVFTRDGNKAAPQLHSVRDIGVRLVVPAGADNLIALPDDYLRLVERVATAASDGFEYSANCKFVPRLPPGDVPTRTEDIAALRNGEIITIQLLDPFGLDGVNELCVPIMKEIERNVYGSYAIVDKVYVYRSPPSRQIPSASWVWHYDNHPRELLKVLIYLTDVTDANAPFEYLRDAQSLAPFNGSPLTPFFGHSRISNEEVERHLSMGGECTRVTGPAGTMLVFDDNVIHRANLARESHRDVLVFQVRPATFKPDSYISKRWTGSFLHDDINKNPRDVTPHPKY